MTIPNIASRPKTFVCKLDISFLSFDIPFLALEDFIVRASVVEEVVVQLVFVTL